MAREIPGLANLLNILAQNRAQERSDARFERQIGLQEQQMETAQENFLETLAMEMEQLGMSKKQLQAQLESADVQRRLNELLLSERRDLANRPEASMYRNVYERLIPNVDPSMIEGGIPAFSATDTSWLDALLAAQRVETRGTPSLSGHLLDALDPMTTIRDEWNKLDPIARQQYSGLDAYRSERLPELLPKYNLIAPMFGLSPISLDQPQAQIDVEVENLNTPEWRQQASERAQQIVDRTLQASPMQEFSTGINDLLRFLTGDVSALERMNVRSGGVPFEQFRPEANPLERGLAYLIYGGRSPQDVSTQLFGQRR